MKTAMKSHPAINHVNPTNFNCDNWFKRETKTPKLFMRFIGNKPKSIDLLERQLDIAVAKSEFKRIRLFIGALLIGLVVMSFNFFVIKGTTSFFTNSVTEYWVVGWFISFLGYETFAYFLARNYQRIKTTVPKFLKTLNVITEAFFPTVLLFILCFLEFSVIFLDSPLIFFYFILITLSSLNLDTRLSIILGLVSAGGYLLVTIWAIDTYDPLNEILHFPPVLYYARSLFMMITALSATFVAFEIKRRHMFSFSIKSERDQMELLFDQQVSKEVVETLLNDNFSQKKHEVSILFLDIRNYSSFVEASDPTDVIEFQNKFFDPILRIIKSHEGITNQILGDGLMATFGAPVNDPKHAQHGFNAGLDILSEIERLVLKKQLPLTRIGIGLHCGNVVLGNIGNEIRKQFSISGAAVVIAARLEQATKEHEDDFLISKEILESIDSGNAQVASLGSMKMKNISKKVEVFGIAP